MEKNKLKKTSMVIENEAGGALFKIQKNKIFFLIVHRIKEGDWSLPKGHLEINETFEECVLREIVEETGWHGELVSEIGRMKYIHRDKKQERIRDVRVKFFLVKAEGKVKSSKPLDGVSSCKWIEYGDDLINKITYPAQRNILTKATAYIKRRYGISQGNGSWHIVL